jgi:hypothetical protein
MFVDKQILTETLLRYLNHKISLEELVSWAEEMMAEGDFDQVNFELIRDILSRLGLADVKEFGLSWEDCWEFLHRLGYTVAVNIS